MSAKPVRRSTFVREVADLYGRRHVVRISQHGLTSRAAFDELPESPDSCQSREWRTPEQLRSEIWQAVAAAYNDWSRSGRLTIVQLRTIRLLLLEALPLREVARREGVKPAAISARIEGLKDKAQKFYLWWSMRHCIRRQAARNRHAR